MDENLVDLLRGGCRRSVRAYGVVAPLRQRVWSAAGQSPGGHPLLPGRRHRGQELELRPEALRATSTSPSRPWGLTWRAQAFSAP